MIKTYKLNVNGFEIEAQYSQECKLNLFEPLLAKLKELHIQKGKQIVVFLVAPPAVGKTTLAVFLEYLAKEKSNYPSFQSISLDGFHYPQAYLNCHMIELDGAEVLMKDVKGCPETFDIEQITEKIKQMKQENITWPVYDRMLHDVREDQLLIQEDIILIEGNWLLLDEDKWRTLKDLCDYSIYIDADEALLKQRLIHRKIMGGLSYEAASKFYEFSDSKNVKRVLQHSQDADLNWCLCEGGDYKKER